MATRLDPDRAAGVVAATFGLAYVVANAGAVDGPAGVTLQVAGVLAWLVVAGLLLRPRRAGHAPDPPGGAFGRGYRLVVAAEVAAIVVGVVVLRLLVDAPRAPLAWVTLVVGVHFFGLAAVWEIGFFRLLGAVTAALGAVGLVLAVAGGSDAAIAVVAGVVPGVLLLGSAARPLVVRRE